ncbi:F-box protein SKP2B-like [Pyrus ussuriensis x Pyrus communis]|uniref:F-box protein SKP2B-like n=1 Tax=Pyrus ussuriensis x Pyrus communis TaxID=2448454 RepID=A0A5N5I9F9_9ROSA|nr:F-box protein SKP2B-like [Pyrus ussuriensis x Pyrus communis]
MYFISVLHENHRRDQDNQNKAARNFDHQQQPCTVQVVAERRNFFYWFVKAVVVVVGFLGSEF